ncbi:MAG: NAD-glutamate dehydrogenase [Propionibacteriales bacterium]|nr:NAD-glutamate dehydrogenase [Propionibacteriales bacterium]
MHPRQDQPKDELLQKTIEFAHSRREATGTIAGDVATLIRTYYRHVAFDDIADRSPADLYGAAVRQYRDSSHRPQGTANVRVFTPTVDEHGWSADGHTVLEIATDDMPFLVDSVTMELLRREYGIYVVVHPQVLVKRDIAGELVELVDGDADKEGAADEPGVLRESWMHVEIDRESDRKDLEDIQNGIQRVLRDVREAVEDWQKMKQRAESIIAELRDDAPPLDPTEVSETAKLLSWLADNHFTFLGYREYLLQSAADGDEILKAVPGSGLGILRSDQHMSPSFGKLPPEVRARARDKHLLILTKANTKSTVHRSAYLDYVGVKSFDENGEVAGERRFLGLFSSAAYTESVTRIPVLRRKADNMIERAGFDSMSHSGKALMDILETYPRDELFQTPVDDLLPIAESVMHLQERRQLRLFVRRDTYGRYLSCLVYLPRDRYTTEVRQKMMDILMSSFDGLSIDYTARVTESVLARVHFVVRTEPGQMPQEFSVADIEARLAEAARTWDDDFAQAVHELVGEEEAARLTRAYMRAFLESYKEVFAARTGAVDLRRIEELGEDDDMSLSLYDPVDTPPEKRRLKIYATGRPLSLSQILPLLTRMGCEVVDEHPYEVMRPNGRPANIYDFGLTYARPFPEECRGLFQDAFLATWRGQTESDGFNRLVLAAGLDWRQVSVLRAYAKYLRQGATPFSQNYIEDALVANVSIVRMLLELFEARFNPNAPGGQDADVEERRMRVAEIEQRIEKGLDAVASLDEDRILNSYLTVIRATLRTNFFQPGKDGTPRTYTSFKLEPTAIPGLPEPRPQYEIFVYSPRFEGVHLRFGAVARGGLRWSDRREDFRTEILGLVKAQMVKNTVIVPVGAKGGFVCKQLPSPAEDREAWLAEGTACYKMFISGLLDITDNLVNGEAVPPRDVVRHDNHDSYLVVAADKGTATFSDIANGVAKDYGFWLGDAFASGGSVGYDHKAMGITARGGWESVRRHFRELGIDCQNEDFTCVGIGDMSGDVFGNGMLLSEHTRMLAAFDHRHVFLDPDPDPATSYAERRRVFELPRSTWEDYNPELISTGGGVFPRTAKSVPISAEVRKALGIEGKVTKVTPHELLHAILLAPVDLLWNGGIGTYVKAETETHADAGDRANDAIRVNGSELRCKVVGEGGNLGLTQRGRIEFARNGGRVNTDFIDNSAGVDTSDREVNIKILLDGLVRDGDLTEKQRNELLASMTDEVGQLVLQDNYDQNIALMSATAQAAPLLHVHEDWMNRLGKAGLLDRELEFLPSSKEIQQRKADDAGLTQPELSTLLAYTKIALAEDILASDLPDDPFLLGSLFSYFPSAMRDRYRQRMESHALRREIIVTQVVNDVINTAGITFFHRLSQESGASAEEIFRAHLVAREIFGANAVLAEIDGLDNKIAADVQVRMRLQVRTLIERASRWLVNNRRHPIDSAATVDLFGIDVRRVVEALPDILAGGEGELFEDRRAGLVKVGAPEDLAARTATMPPAYAALSAVDTAKREGIDAVQVARVHFAVGERLGIGHLIQRILALPRDDRWKTMARAALRDDLHAVHAQITAQVLTTTDADLDHVDRVKQWAEHDGVVLGRATSTLEEIWSEDKPDLAQLSVGLRVVRTLLSRE